MDDLFDLAKSLARAEARHLDPPEPRLYVCPTCEGRGRVMRPDLNKYECPHCFGTGEVSGEDFHMGFQCEVDPMDILKARRESE